ncbi:hypothetical protein TNCV_725161 [Trichonephila clavipes]|nr:hypothetical protein TNCV_725161 [Trichonephila clavipes]
MCLRERRNVNDGYERRCRSKVVLKTLFKEVCRLVEQPRVHSCFHFFVVTEMLPAKTVFEVPGKAEITRSKVGAYDAWSKRFQPEDLINSRVVREVRGLALLWRSKTSFDSMLHR